VDTNKYTPILSGIMNQQFQTLNSQEPENKNIFTPTKEINPESSQFTSSTPKNNMAITSEYLNLDIKLNSIMKRINKIKFTDQTIEQKTREIVKNGGSRITTETFDIPKNYSSSSESKTSTSYSVTSVGSSDSKSSESSKSSDSSDSSESSSITNSEESSDDYPKKKHKHKHKPEHIKQKGGKNKKDKKKNKKVSKK
jgi:hypothetical protein